MSSSFEQECSAYAINSEEDIMAKNGISFKQEISHELPSLWDLFTTCLLIGILGFGPTMISETKKRIFQEQRWLDEEELSNGLALAQLLPGATYVSLTAYVGYKICGTLGSVIAVIGFLLPPFAMMMGLSYAYFTFGNLPQVSLLLQGLAVIVAALLCNAIIEIAKSAMTDVKTIAIMAAAIVMVNYSNIFILLILAGFAGIIIFKQNLVLEECSVPKHPKSVRTNKLTSLFLVAAFIGLYFILEALDTTLLNLSLVFFQMGSLLFGGGMSMLPFIEQQVVREYHWLTQEHFITGIALGQATPGPILIIATFVGYKVAGIPGAFAATVGIFSPTLVLVTAFAEIHQKVKNNLQVRAAIKGIVAAFNGMIIVFALRIAVHSITDVGSMIIALSALVLMRNGNLPIVWIVLIGAASYWLVYTTIFFK